VDYGDVCLNYDIQWFRDHDLSPPSDLSQLTAQAYKGLTVVENPATSSPGLAFLLATVGAFGEEGYTAFWKKMKQNDVLVSDGWEAAYWGHFSAASEGNRPIVVSYASSPPAEVHFAEQPLAAAPTAAVIAPGTCFRQIEFVGILKGTKDRDLAEKLVDFMLERQFQEDIPLQMFVFPANRTAVLPEVFVTYAKTAEAPVAVDPERIAAMREQWVEGWGAAVLR